MRINSFQYESKLRKWKFNTITFDRLTLLVGASGVGKTQILDAIEDLKRVAEGESLNGVKWHVNFTVNNGDIYDWKGEFELDKTPVFDYDDEEALEENAKIIYEEILKNGSELIRRNEDKTLFNGQEIIKLSRESSVLDHLEEDFINQMKYELGMIHLNDYSNAPNEPYIISPFHANDALKKYNTLHKIRQSELDIRAKLHLAYHNESKVFEQIKARFIDIFPQVEDLKIAPLEFDYSEKPPSFIREHHFIQIKEKNVPEWIAQGRMSSGMFRTLIQISELYLATEGTLFLIDEFENSLGINCIDELTEDILQARQDLQFVLTSHHPYIINSINFKHWKLVTRDGGVVKTHPASKFNLGKSKHDAFMQLLQLDAYQTGSELIPA